MEKAIVIYSLQHIPKDVYDYERIYFGSEFCQLRIPNISEVKKIIEIAREGNIKLTMLTPICSNNEMGKIENILREYGNILRQFDFEVVINDWGMFDILENYPYAVKVAGRSLLNYKKDPRFSKLPVIPDEMKYNEAQSEVMQDFLHEKGCTRIEFDNLEYLLNGLEKTKKFCFSVYLPYVCVTTTRLCRMQDGNLFDVENGLRLYNVCDRKCEKYLLELQNEDIGEKIYVRGNTQYFQTKVFSTKWYELHGINRLIFDDIKVVV